MIFLVCNISQDIDAKQLQKCVSNFFDLVGKHDFLTNKKGTLVYHYSLSFQSFLLLYDNQIFSFDGRIEKCMED